MSRLNRWATAVLMAVLALRLITLGLYPLTDSTEARYAEMARQMVVTGNWLTPMFDAETATPFWGKPPLSFWLSALPVALLGASEFSVRLGPLLALLSTLASLLFWEHTFQYPRGQSAGFIRTAGVAPVAALVLLSTPLGFIAGGAVMTDMAMVAGTTLAMVAFKRSVIDAPGPGAHPTPWRWLFFVGLAVGLLAKGPVSVVLTGLALFGWWLLRRRGQLALLQQAWQRLPWVRGLLLTAVLTVPWYLLAERATPGFLNYFLVGEHWHRFTQAGWKGDLYGVAHAQPKGRIWLFAVVCTVPWLLLWPVWAWLARRSGSAPIAQTSAKGTEVHSYLWAWALAPCVFFTMSGNILPAYVLPGLPAFALLVASTWSRWATASRVAHGFTVLGLVVPAAFAGVVLFAPHMAARYSDQALIQQHATSPERVVYLFERPDSGAWYTQGRARRLRDTAAAQSLVQSGTDELLLVPEQKLGLAEPLRLAENGWREVGRNAVVIAYRRSAGTPTPTAAATAPASAASHAQASASNLTPSPP